MTHPNKLNFVLDSFTLPFIFKAIEDVASTTVESMAQTLTDRPAKDGFSAEEIQWMKTTPLSQITMGESYVENGSSTFFDLKTDGESKLKISGRTTNNGEFRGDIVRTIISTAALQGKSDISLYDAFQSNLRNVANNANFIYAANAIANQHLASTGFSPESPVFQYLQQELKNRITLFGQSVDQSLGKISKPYYDENNDLTPEAAEFLTNKFDDVLNKHPFPQPLVQFIKAFEQFETQLHAINEKAQEFKPDSLERTATTALHKELSTAKANLCHGTISVDEFKTKCQDACQTAEKSALKEHRGWKQIIANVGFAVASIATLGVANVLSKVLTKSFNFSKTNTDSINKMQDMKDILKNMRSNSIEPSNSPNANIQSEYDVSPKM